METWVERKQWADQFTPNIKTILGHLFIREASVDADQRENTDLLFEIFDRRFAVRVRRISERAEYNRRNEWTIRLTPGRGGATELSRVIRGFGDYCLYGWGDKGPPAKVKGWTVFDLAEVRAWLFGYVMQHKRLPGQQQVLPDGGTFVALCIDDMPPQTIVRRHTVLPGDPEDKKPIVK